MIKYYSILIFCVILVPIAAIISVNLLKKYFILDLVNKIWICKLIQDLIIAFYAIYICHGAANALDTIAIWSDYLEFLKVLSLLFIPIGIVTSVYFIKELAMQDKIGLFIFTIVPFIDIIILSAILLVKYIFKTINKIFKHHK